jgi:hypothetical protein
VSSGVLLFFKSNKNNFKIVTPELELMGLGIGDWGLWIGDCGLGIGSKWIRPTQNQNIEKNFPRMPNSPHTPYLAHLRQ